MWQLFDWIMHLMVSFHFKWGNDSEDAFDEEKFREKLTNKEEYLSKKKERRALIKKYPFLKEGRESINELHNSASYHVSIGDGTPFEREIIPVLEYYLENYGEFLSNT